MTPEHLSGFGNELASEALAGADATFHVKVNGIQKKELPELDDEFAKDVSEYDTLDELKAAYAQGVLSVRHGDKTVQYASGEDMRRRIDDIQREIDIATHNRKATCTAVRFRDR